MVILRKNEILEMPVVGTGHLINGNPLEFIKGLRKGETMKIVHCYDNDYDAEAKYVIHEKKPVAYLSSDYIPIVGLLMDDFYGLDVAFDYAVINEEDKPWFVVRLSVPRDIEDNELCCKCNFIHRFSAFVGIPRRGLNYSLSSCLYDLLIGYRKVVDEIYAGKLDCHKVRQLNKLVSEYIPDAAESLGLENRIAMVLITNFMKKIKDYDEENGLARACVKKSNEYLDLLLQQERMKAKEGFCSERFKRHYSEMRSLFQENNTLDKYYKLRIHKTITKQELIKEKEFINETLYSIKNSPWALSGRSLKDFSKGVFYQRFCIDDIYEFIALMILLEDLEMRIKNFKECIVPDNKILILLSKKQKSKKRPEIFFKNGAEYVWNALKKLDLLDNEYQLTDRFSKQLCVYFIEKLSDRLLITKRWKYIEEFWDIKNLAQIRGKYMKGNVKPKGHEIIDDLIEQFVPSIGVKMAYE